MFSCTACRNASLTGYTKTPPIHHVFGKASDCRDIRQISARASTAASFLIARAKKAPVNLMTDAQIICFLFKKSLCMFRSTTYISPLLSIIVIIELPFRLKIIQLAFRLFILYHSFITFASLF